MNKQLALSEISKVIEEAWKEIMQQNKGVGNAIFTLYAQKIKKSGEYTAGYYWQERWITRDNKTHFDEVHINTYILKDGGRSVFITLLHEAVHSYCNKKNIQDTSRNNRYHNKNFKIYAEKFGLKTDHHKTIGVTTPDITDETTKTYKAIIDKLEKTIKVYQNMTSEKTKDGKEKKNYSLKATCQCGTIIRASKTVLDAKTITCSECNSTFEAEE